MKKFLICCILISATYLVLLIFNKQEAHSNVAGAPAGKTGSPGDASNCSGCHTGSSVITNQSLITSDIPTDGYVPGVTYNITASISKPGINKFGFQVSPQNTIGQLKGTLINSTPTLTQLISTGKYITHKSAGTAGTSNSNTWNFQWTAPAAGTGALTFYGAFVAANNSGNTSGDQVFLSSLPVQENSAIGVAEQTSHLNWKLFPVPCKNELYLQTENYESERMQISIFSTTGELVKQSDCIVDPLKNNISIQTQELPPGTYVIKATNNAGELMFHKKFIKA